MVEEYVLRACKDGYFIVGRSANENGVWQYVVDCGIDDNDHVAALLRWGTRLEGLRIFIHVPMVVSAVLQRVGLSKIGTLDEYGRVSHRMVLQAGSLNMWFTVEHGAVYLRFNPVHISGESYSVYIGGPGPSYRGVRVVGYKSAAEDSKNWGSVSSFENPRAMWCSPSGESCRQMVEEYLWNALVNNAMGAGGIIHFGRVINDHGNYQYIVDTELIGMSSAAHFARWSMRLDVIRICVKLPLGADAYIPGNTLAPVMGHYEFLRAPHHLMVQEGSLRLRICFENSGLFLRFKPLSLPARQRSVCLGGAGFVRGEVE